MSSTTPQVNSSDPAVAIQVQRENAALQRQSAIARAPSVTGSSTTTTTTASRATRSLAPVVSGSEVLYPQSTTSTSRDAVTINSSVNNDSGDVTTVYSTGGAITVNPINQTINQYTSVDSGVSQIVAGNGVTITSTGGSGTGVVTINSGTTAFGNIVSINLDGNAANVLHGDGTWSADQTTYGNSNVAAYLPTYTGNIGGNVITANLFSGNGSSLRAIAGANVSGFVPNANVANTAFAVAAANVSGLGNIATVNLTGSNANVLYGNGVFAPVSGAGGLPLANGNSNFNIATANGNATVGVAGEYTWTFDTTGNVTIPGSIIGTSTINIDNRATGNNADINLYSADDITLQARDRDIGSTAEGGDINIYAGDSAEDSDTSGGDVIIEAGNGGASNIDFGGSGGFIRIEAGDGGAASANYEALSGGSLTLTAGDAGTNNGNIFRGSSGGDVTINAGDSTGNGDPGGEIILNTGLAGANALAGRVQINIPSSANGNGGTWTFGGDGSTIYPNLTVTRGDRTGTLTGQTLLFGDSTQEAIITTPNGTNDINASQRFVINPGAGAANTTGEGGDIYLYAGRGGDLGGSGGDIKIRGGLGPVDGAGGYLDIQGGDTQGNGTGGYIDIRGGESGNAIGGAVNLYGGYGPTVGGNVTITGGQSGTGDGGNVTITGGVGGNGLLTYGNVNIAAGASTWAFDNTGNLVLPGNTFAVNYANGTQVPLGGGGNTGNVTFDDVTVQGDNQLNLSAGPDFTANLAYLQVRAGDVASHIHLDTGNNEAYDLIVGDDSKFVQVSSTGDIIMSSYDGNTSYTWTLDTTGNLILAGGESVIQSVANSSLDPLNPNVSTMILTPSVGYSSQSLVLDPTLPGHIHLRAPGANIDEPLANIFLGGEESSFEVGYHNGNAPNAFIHSGGNTWTFDNGGNLTFPRDAAGNTDPILTIAGGATPRILSADVSLAGPANLEITALNTIFTGSSGSAIKIYADDGEIGSTANLQIWTNSGGNTEYSWTFDDTGNLTVPGNTTVSTAESTGGAAGKNISVVAGAADQSDFYTTAGGNLNLSGGLGATDDGGGGGPGGSVNISAGLSADPVGVSGNVVVTVGGSIYTFTELDLNVTTNPPASPAPSLNGFGLVSAPVFTNGNGNVTINSNSNEWVFDSTGNLTIPGSSGGFIKTVANASIGIAAVDNGTNNPAQLLSMTDAGAATSIISAYATNALIQTNATGSINTWAFDSTGNLTLPGNAVAIKFANGSSAFGNIATINLNGNTSQVLLGNGAFAAIPSSSIIANGNSNVSIASSNGNVVINAVGGARITATATGANVAGTLTSTGKIGYASGSTVTQTTNRGNGVTINALAGTIITTSATMVAGQIDTFSVANDQVDPNNDIVLVQIVSPNFGVYNCVAQPSSTISTFLNGFYVNIQNISGFTTTSDAITIRFMVIKAPNA